MAWSVPAGRLGGLAVRLHLVLLIWAVLRLVRSIPHDARGWVFELWWLACLGLVLVAREVAVWALVTRSDRSAASVVLWPVGNALPPSTDAAAGPCVGSGLVGLGVSLLLFVGLGGALYAMTGRWDAVLFWPIDQAGLEREMYAEGVVLGGLWTLHAVGAGVLLFNLLPMLPLDGGRLVMGTIRARGSGEALGPAVGMLTAVVLAAVGWLTETTPVIAVAAGGFFVCWQEQRRGRLLGPAEWEGDDWTEPAEADDDTALFDPPEPVPADETVATQTATEPEDDPIDAILAKISRSGLGSLTEAERTLLDAASGNRGAAADHEDR